MATQHTQETRSKAEISRSAGRFKYVIFDVNGAEFSRSNSTISSAVNLMKECKGEAWLDGRMVMRHV